MAKQAVELQRQRMVILGELLPDSFLPWIGRHASKLGLSSTITHASAGRIELDLVGREELIDMMEIGCILGPIDVWVESIQRQEPSDHIL
nr:acylphosphatase [Ciceribacter lividus]